MDLVAKEEEALDAIVFCGGEGARSWNNAGLETKTVSSGSLPQASSFEALLLGIQLTGNSSEGRASGSSVSSHGRAGRPPLPPPRPPRPPPRPPPPPLDISNSAQFRRL